MSETREDIGHWFDEGVGQQSTHLLVVFDPFSCDHYPVFATGDEDALAKHAEHSRNELRVMEVYDLRFDKDEQLSERRAMHLPVAKSTFVRTAHP